MYQYALNPPPERSREDAIPCTNDVYVGQIGCLAMLALGNVRTEHEW